MSTLHTWLVIGPLALVCYGAVVHAIGKALGSRSQDYPPLRLIPRSRSNYAPTAGGHNDLRKVRG